MNTVYEPAFYNEIGETQVDIEYATDAVVPLGTFAGTIYKTLYRDSKGRFIPSDTSAFGEAQLSEAEALEAIHKLNPRLAEIFERRDRWESGSE
jgi:hypothetical protein